MDQYQLEKGKVEDKSKDVNKEKHLKGKCQKFQVSMPVRALAGRFLKTLLVKIFSDNFFHNITNLDMVLSDRRAKFQISAPVRALARRFLNILLVKIFSDNFFY